MKKRFIIGGIILILVAGYLLFLSIDSSLSYYITVSELLETDEDIYNTDIRVAGKVADSPITWNAEKLRLSFDITEGGSTLSVIYYGTKPDGMTAGSDIVAAGQYNQDNRFYADSLVLKCPSKYEIKD